MVYYVTQVLKQSINVKSMCPNDKLQFRNTNLHLLRVNPGTYAKIKIVFKNKSV